MENSIQNGFEFEEYFNDNSFFFFPSTSLTIVVDF